MSTIFILLKRASLPSASFTKKQTNLNQQLVSESKEKKEKILPLANSVPLKPSGQLQEHLI